MPTTFANTINGNPIYAARAESDKDGNRIDTTYVKLADIPPGVTVDQTYSPSSTNAQSGTAVAGALSGINQVPASTSADEDKVLTVDSNGNPVWAASQGAPQVQADWNESDTADPSYIQHKPTEKVLTAGSNVTITDGVSEVTISATDTTYTAGPGLVLNNGAFSVDVGSGLAVTNEGLSAAADQTYSASSTNAQSGVAVAGAIAGINQVPVSTASDEDKVLTVNSSGTPVWRTPSGGGGGSGVQADWTESDSTDPSYIRNKPAEKPILPGNGIAMSEDANSMSISVNPVSLSSAQLLAISRALGVDETVLYDCSGNYSYGTNSVTLSESYKNFEIIKILTSKGMVQFFYPDNAQSVTLCTLYNISNSYMWLIPWTFTSNTVFSGATGKLWSIGATTTIDIPSNSTSNRWIQPIKIIGVKRIAGGN